MKLKPRNQPKEKIMAMNKEREALVERLRDDPVRAALLFCLWHHQGGSSRIGQAIRLQLGIGEYERLSDDQLAAAKAVQAALTAQPQQEPVAWEWKCVYDMGKWSVVRVTDGFKLWGPIEQFEATLLINKLHSLAPLYTAPPSGVQPADGRASMQAELGAALGSALSHYKSGDMQACAASLVRIVDLFRDAAKEPRK